MVAVAEGGPASILDDGRSGLLRGPRPDALAGAICELADSPELRARLGAGGRSAVLERSWDRALERLAAGYRRALAAAAVEEAAGTAALAGRRGADPFVADGSAASA